MNGVRVSQFQKKKNGSDPGADHVDDPERMVSVKCEISFEGGISFVLSAKRKMGDPEEDAQQSGSSPLVNVQGGEG